MRRNRRPRFEPVEDIDGFDAPLAGQAVKLRVARGAGASIRALVQAVDMRRTGPRAVQPKSSQETKTVEHLAVIGQAGHDLVIPLLVQI